MSHCEDKGRHQTIFLTKEDSQPEDSKVEFNAPVEGAPEGLITKDGEINWGCPCLGGMPVGPCGVEFRTAFECFHYSEEEPKGSECFEKFATLQECLSKYPDLYGNGEEDSSKLLGKADENLKLEEDFGDKAEQNTTTAELAEK